jgi:hypothetical protein
MVEIIVVDPVGELLGENYDRFVEAKRNSLPYLEASLRVPLGPNQLTFSRAHLGAVKSLEDAGQFLAALAESMPSHEFVTRTKRYDDATEVVWHHI